MQRRGHMYRGEAGAGAVAVALLLAACSSSGGGGGGGGGGGPSGNLKGSGSTLQLPFEQAAVEQFKSIQPDMTVDYAGVGFGQGRSDLASGVTNFGGSDTAPIPSDEVSNFKGKKVLYFPILIGPITVSYNLPG